MPTTAVLLTMMLILLFTGTFMDRVQIPGFCNRVGIVLLIIPVFLPIVQRLPIEEIGLVDQLEAKYVAVWFGVLFYVNMQVNYLSPPFAPAAFYLKSLEPPQWVRFCHGGSAFSNDNELRSEVRAGWGSL